MGRAFTIAIVGAESTGKSTLAAALQAHFAAGGERVGHVAEYLREFCVTTGRTPRQDEQATIAAEQTRRIEAAAATHDLVIADTTALMIAVYSDQVFGDTGLYAGALADHGRVADLTLLTALDLPWQADGDIRDGPHVRGPVDRKLRAALVGAGLPFGIVAGQGEARVQHALRSIAAARRTPPAAPSGWRHLCARCGDGDCERRLFKP